MPGLDRLPAPSATSLPVSIAFCSLSVVGGPTGSSGTVVMPALLSSSAPVTVSWPSVGGGDRRTSNSLVSVLYLLRLALQQLSLVGQFLLRRDLGFG